MLDAGSDGYKSGGLEAIEAGGLLVDGDAISIDRSRTMPIVLEADETERGF